MGELGAEPTIKLVVVEEVGGGELFLLLLSPEFPLLLGMMAILEVTP